MNRSANIALIALVSCGISGLADAHDSGDPPLGHRHDGIRLHAHYSQQALPGQGSYPHVSTFNAVSGGYGQYSAPSYVYPTYSTSYGYHPVPPSGGLCCTYPAPLPVSYLPTPCPVGWGVYSGRTEFW